MFFFIFENRKLCLKLFFQFFIYFLSIYLYIYQNFKFHILKILPHPSTINPKSRLVNTMSITIFYFSLKVSVKVISVNIKIDLMNVVFVTISHYFILRIYNLIATKVYCVNFELKAYAAWRNKNKNKTTCTSFKNK